MIDSYQAPADLAEARDRAEAVAADRYERLASRSPGSSTEAEREAATVRISGKRFDRSKTSADASVVMADLVLWRWDDASLTALAERLKPGAALVFIEPTADLGWRRGLHRMTKNIWWMALRHNFESDTPARLRAAGLVVTTTDRFAVGPLGIRSYVWGIAEHIGPAEHMKPAEGPISAN